MFVILYKDQPIVDLFNEKGELISRTDLSKALKKSGFTFMRSYDIKFPYLVWSDRGISEFVKLGVLSQLVIGCQTMHEN